jgi:hypothetical protein
MKFEYDIFISFAPDTVKEDEWINQWSSKFCQYLAILMNRITDKKPTILSQDDLQARSKLLGSEKSKIFSETAVFVNIIAPEYVQSKGYVKELEEIYNTVYAKSNKTSSETNRIFKVLISPVDEEYNPEFLMNELCYDFFEINRYSKKAKTFDINEGGENYEKFWSSLVDLAYDIQDALSSLISNDTANRDKEEHQYIYIAETSIDQKDNRDVLRRELQHLGYRILPPVQLPNDGNVLPSLISGYLEKAILSVHLMGVYYGDYIKNSKFSIIDIQNQVSKEFIEKSDKSGKLVKMIWIPNDLKPTDQRQSLYIKRLIRDEDRQNTEIIEAPLEVFKSILDNKLRELKKPEKTIDKNKTKVYLVYEKGQKDKLDKLIKEINSRNYGILDIYSGTNNEKAVTTHIDNLIEADAVLIYQGNSREEWLDSKIRDLIKAPGYGKATAFKTLGILAKSNPDKNILGYLSDTNIIIEKDINPAFIKNFLDTLK